MWLGNLDFHSKDGLSLQYHACGLAGKIQMAGPPNYLEASLSTCLAPEMDALKTGLIWIVHQSTPGFIMCLELPQSMVPSV